MKLTGNTFPFATKSISRTPDQTSIPASKFEPNGFEFHSLMREQKMLEPFQKNPVHHVPPEVDHSNREQLRSENEGDPDQKIDQNIELLQSLDVLQLLDVPQSLDISLTEDMDLFAAPTNKVVNSDLLLPLSVQIGIVHNLDTNFTATRAQILNPERLETSDQPLLPQLKKDGLPSKLFASANPVEINKPLVLETVFADLNKEQVKTPLATASRGENKAQAIVAPKDQPAILLPEKEDAKSSTNRVVEQKFAVVPVTIVITKAIVQNVQTQRADASPNIFGVLVPDSPRSLQSIEVQLAPKNLGVVEVRIKHSNRRLNIVIEAKTREAESLLRSEIAQISKSLVAAGLTVDEITVRFNPRLEQIEQRDLRLVDAPSDKPDPAGFDNDKNLQSRAKPTHKSNFHLSNLNKFSESSDRQMPINADQRKGIYM